MNEIFMWAIGGGITLMMVLMGIIWKCMNTKFDKIDSKFDLIDKKFDKIFDKFDERFNQFDSKIDKLSDRVNSIDGRLSRVEGAIFTRDYFMIKDERRLMKVE